MGNIEHELPPLAEDVAEIIAHERRRPVPPAEVRQRVFQRIAASLDFGPIGGGPDDDGDGAPQTPPTTGGPGGAPSTGPTGTVLGQSARLSRLTRLFSAAAKPAVILTFAGGYLAGLGTYAVFQRQTSPPSVQSSPAAAGPSFQQRPPPVAVPLSSPDPHRPAGAAAGAQVPPGPPPPQTKPAPKRPGGRQRPSPSHASTFAAENQLIEMARAALARGRGEDALRALDKHRRLFAEGQLIEEREALTVLALVASGQGQRAQARAESFRRRFPNSLLWPTVADALAKKRLMERVYKPAQNR